MTTKLDKVLKREVEIRGEPYIVALSPMGVKLTQKGKRKGQELSWAGLLDGQGAVASAPATGSPSGSTDDDTSSTDDDTSSEE
jgi:hypothetical protein